MKLSVKGMAIAGALCWAGMLLIVGLINRFSPSYGWLFLKTVDSIYPGYHAVFGLKSLVFGVLYALLDGAIGGAVLAWVYNMASCCCAKKESTPETSG